MPDIISSLISSVIGGLMVAVVNHFFTRKKLEAEIQKLTAESAKIRAETEVLRIQSERREKLG